MTPGGPIHASLIGARSPGYDHGVNIVVQQSQQGGEARGFEWSQMALPIPFPARLVVLTTCCSPPVVLRRGSPMGSCLR